MATVDKYHPAPQHLSAYVRKLMARNAKIFGSEWTLQNFCYLLDSDGADGINKQNISGGTGQAIRIAAASKSLILLIRHLQRVVSINP